MITVDSARRCVWVKILPLLGKRGNELHLVLNLHRAPLDVGGGVLGGEFPGIGQCGGYQRALGACEVDGLLVEMMLRTSLHAVDAIAHLYGVEIDFHDALLAPHQFDEKGEVCLKPLAHPTAARPQEDILRRLLRDGAATMDSSAIDVVSCGLLYGVHVEPMMKKKTLILTRHHCHGHVGTNLIHGNPRVVPLQRLALTSLLEKAYHHEGRDIDRQKLVDNNRQDGKGQKKRQPPTHNLLQ